MRLWPKSCFCAGAHGGRWVVLPATAPARRQSLAVRRHHGSGALTFTLTGDCDTTVPLTVPDGFTVDGAGFTITAHDASPTVLFEGAVVTNGGTSMNVSNLTIQGTGFAGCSGILTGIFFVNASGSVSDVVVEGITANNGCQRGLGIRANALTGPAQTVTITGTTVSGYQKGGLVASGNMTMDVSESTIGPPDELTDRDCAERRAVRSWRRRRFVD